MIKTQRATAYRNDFAERRCISALQSFQHRPRLSVRRVFPDDYLGLASDILVGKVLGHLR